MRENQPMDEKSRLPAHKREVLRILSARYGIDETELMKDPRFSDADDSLALVEWVMELEEQLGSDA